MKLVTCQDVRKLAVHEDGACASVYLPTHITGSEVRQDPIRFKNLLVRCRDKIEEKYGRQKADKIMKPAFELLDTFNFKTFEGRGLAIFTGEGVFKCFKLSTCPDQWAYTGKFFYILPLICEMLHDRIYYIINLDLNDLRLFKIHLDEAQEVELPGAYRNIEELMEYYDPEEQLQVRSAQAGKAPGTGAIFHGQGNIADDAKRKKYIDSFVIEAAKVADRKLQGEQAPLILAGAEYEQAMFRKCSSYRYLMDEGISCEEGPADVRRLGQKALHIVKADRERAIDKLVSQYFNLTESPKTSERIEDILPAAYGGRVETLLVKPSACIYGKFNPESEDVYILSEDDADARELVNAAAVHSIRHEGEVYIVNEDSIESPAVAIFRY